MTAVTTFETLINRLQQIGDRVAARGRPGAIMVSSQQDRVDGDNRFQLCISSSSPNTPLVQVFIYEDSCDVEVFVAATAGFLFEGHRHFRSDQQTAALALDRIDALIAAIADKGIVITANVTDQRLLVEAAIETAECIERTKYLGPARDDVPSGTRHYAPLVA